MGLERFVERPLGVAAALDQGACGGSYAEACILVSGLISSISSFVWPGTGMDRKRFVEAWVRFGGAAALKVSVPLLRLSLRADGRLDEAQLLERARPRMFGPGYDARVLTGDEVDATEAEVRSWCSTIDRDTLRAHAYPVLFYEQVRSRLVHEYELSGSATAHPMTIRNAGVSYANRIIPIAGAALDKWHDDRRIHFDVAWLSELTRTIAKDADTQYPEGKAAHPKPWWLDDGLPEEVDRALAAVLGFLGGRSSGATAKEMVRALKLGKKLLDRALKQGVRAKKLVEDTTYALA